MDVLDEVDVEVFVYAAFLDGLVVFLVVGKDDPVSSIYNKDLIAALQEHDQLKFLFKVAQASGALKLLENPGPFTILAPTDRAFSQLGQSNCQALLDLCPSVALLPAQPGRK